ncbi:KAP family P-loop NTPase fold protein [Marinomonas sp. PE14-40]|uniref:KAP family P-loop NTPase fold protein n=1 Tax=Marinomonas sp. PE14-40 TaxID=3060621 RepID=UPI003F66C91A
MTDHNTSSDLDNQAAFSDCAYGDREKLARRFTQYLDHRNTTKGAYVANLNGAWGTGKTFFVDNWCQQLKEDNRLAIKIDAWESDYLKDPLAIIVAELLEQVNEQSGLTDFTEKEIKIAKLTLKLVKNAAPTILMALAKHFLGDDWKEIAQALGTSAKDLIDDETNTESTKLGEFGKEVLATHSKHKEFVEAFRDSFIQLLSQANGNNGHSHNKKTYIFIDELDRCRPTYAIEMLETVKHLFNIPNLVFVLSTDTAQLEHSIKAVYGEGFDAREYLSRFFEQRLLLPTPDHFTFLKSKNSFESLGLDVNSQHLFPAIDTKEKVSAVLAMFCEASNISLRRTLQLADKLEMILLNVLSHVFDTSKQTNLFELVACLITRELYFDHAEKLIWLCTYKTPPKEGKAGYENDPRIVHSEKLSDKIMPLLIFEKNLSRKTNLDLIEKMIEWSDKVRSIGNFGSSKSHIKETILGKDITSGHDDYKTIFDSSFLSLSNTFQTQAMLRNKRESFLSKKDIDTLVTLNSNQIDHFNEAQAAPPHIPVGFNM